MATGFSPGTTLVFLMTRPAIATGIIAIVASHFGARFAYVLSFIADILVLGVAIDTLMIAVGLSLAVNLQASDSPVPSTLQWGGAIGLVALMIWRFRAGAFRAGYQDLFSDLRPAFAPFSKWWMWATRDAPPVGMLQPRSLVGATAWMAAVMAIILSGFMVIRPGKVGHGRLFGKVVWRDLQPGLNYLAPWPLARADKWPVRELKSITAGNSTEFLTGDLNLFSASVSLQYLAEGPYAYHYRTGNPEQVISNTVREEMRRQVASTPLDQLPNVERSDLQAHIMDVFSAGGSGAGNAVISSAGPVKVSLLAINPVEEAVRAFRQCLQFTG